MRDKKIFNKKLKGQIAIFETIAVIIILIIAFTVFFPGFSYTNRWDDAILAQKGRDIIATANNLKMIPDLAFDSAKFGSFVNSINPERNLIFWSTTDGAIPNRIALACNCTSEQISQLLQWVGRMKVNGRDFNIDVIQSPLTPIQRSDALLLLPNSGNEDLTPHRVSLVTYLRQGNGIIELRDLDEWPGQPQEIDDVRKELFGLQRCTGGCETPNIDATFIKPTSALQSTYQVYKMFHGLPATLRATTFTPAVLFDTDEMTPEVRTCGDEEASIFAEGTFEFRNNELTFWICGVEKKVYIDIDKDKIAELEIKERENFKIDNFNFLLNYVELNRTFISFKQDYSFTKLDGRKVVPIDGDNSKIVIKAGNYAGSENPVPAMVINATLGTPAIWIEDFTRDETTDDEKVLLASAIVAAANKQPRDIGIARLRFGVLTPYFYTNNTDVFESYLFNLGLGLPF